MVEEDKEAPVDGPALLLESKQVWSVGREGGRERQRLSLISGKEPQCTYIHVHVHEEYMSHRCVCGGC